MRSGRIWKCKRVLFAGVCSAALAAAWPVLAPPAYADTYAYDALGRLIRVDYTGGGFITYNYDPSGNRTVVAVSTIPSPPPPPPPPPSGGPFVVVPLSGYVVIPLPQ